ncbi:MAG: TetR/AcrR family transcriptional regulator [Cyanobacteria bacterium SZAS-4]|nr:TetR/AcrR family transcriptional regulator [Cyanobacteria bacterium SZAS-4]
MASPNVISKEKIMVAATKMAQDHGYGGLNFRELAEAVGIKPASIYHHFPSKADLAAAIATKYWKDCATDLETISSALDPISSLKKYPVTFRRSLQNENRICLASFLAAERTDIPEKVLIEVYKFADVNIAWLSKMLKASGSEEKTCEPRARAIFAAIAGAQMIARSRADIDIFDSIVADYQASGFLPS